MSVSTKNTVVAGIGPDEIPDFLLAIIGVSLVAIALLLRYSYPLAAVVGIAVAVSAMSAAVFLYPQRW